MGVRAITGVPAGLIVLPVRGGADLADTSPECPLVPVCHTLDIYADFVPERVDAAMERLEAVIEEA